MGPVRICIVSKFPPIEGGIASRTYWQVRQLLGDGHEVTVVTNAGATEPDYLIDGCEEHLLWLQSSHRLRIIDVRGDAPWHIPAGPDHLERLLSALLEVLHGETFDYVESGFLIPYGVAAGIAARYFDLPHVIRHGGSDLAKLLTNPQYKELLGRTLREAERVITDEDSLSLLQPTGARTEIAPVYVPDPGAFLRRRGPGHARNTPETFAYIGKINYHWRRRGLDTAVLWHHAQDPARCRLRLVGQGSGLRAFQVWAREAVGHEVEVERFVPPWSVPGLLAGVDSLLTLSVDEPIQSFSMIGAEALAMGIRVLHDLPGGRE